MSDVLASWTSEIVILLIFLQYVHTRGPCLGRKNINQTSSDSEVAAVTEVEGSGDVGSGSEVTSVLPLYGMPQAHRQVRMPLKAISGQGLVTGQMRVIIQTADL